MSLLGFREPHALVSPSNIDTSSISSLLSFFALHCDMRNVRLMRGASASCGFAGALPTGEDLKLHKWLCSRSLGLHESEVWQTYSE